MTYICYTSASTSCLTCASVRRHQSATRNVLRDLFSYSLTEWLKWRCGYQQDRTLHSTRSNVQLSYLRCLHETKTTVVTGFNEVSWRFDFSSCCLILSLFRLNCCWTVIEQGVYSATGTYHLEVDRKRRRTIAQFHRIGWAKVDIVSTKLWEILKKPGKAEASPIVEDTNTKLKSTRWYWEVSLVTSSLLSVLSRYFYPQFTEKSAFSFC